MSGYEIFVINLDEQARRWAFMQVQFQALGLTLTRLRAVNGYDPDELARAAVAPFSPLPNGEVGCFESHRKAWQIIVDRDLPGAFILEDDVVVGSDFGQMDLPAELLAKVDIIKLDTCRWTASYGAPSYVPVPARELRPLYGSETSAGCYFMTRRGAEKMLRHAAGYFIPVDTLMFNLDSKPFYDLTTLKMDPAIAAQLRFVMPKQDLIGEAAESMQEKRRRNIDPRQRMTGLRRARLYLQRLLDWDFKIVRDRRRAAFLKRVTIDGAPRNVRFSTRTAPISTRPCPCCTMVLPRAEGWPSAAALFASQHTQPCQPHDQQHPRGRQRHRRHFGQGAQHIEIAAQDGPCGQIAAGGQRL